MKRNGLSYFAAPLGRVPVTPRPNARLLDDPPLVGWTDKLRRACADKEKTPSRYNTALRQLDRAIFTFANRGEQGNDAKYLVSILSALGQAERTLAGGLSFCKDKYLTPLQGLNPQWLDQANDDSQEFRLAAALAGICGERDGVGPIRAFLEEVEFKGSHAAWSPGSTSAVWSKHRSPQTLLPYFAAGRWKPSVMGRIVYPSGRPGRRRWPTWSPFFAPKRTTRSCRLCCGRFRPLNGRPSVIAHRHRQTPTTGRFLSNSGYQGCLSSLSGLHLTADFGTYETRMNQRRRTPRYFILLRPAGTTPSPLPSIAPRRLKSGGWLVAGYRNRRLAGKPLGVVSSIKPERLLAAMLFPLAQHELEVIANNVLYPPENEE